MRPMAAHFHLLNPDIMTAVIRAITELSVELKFNDRFGCPHNAMWVCVMIWGFISESHNKRHLLETRIIPLRPTQTGPQRNVGYCTTVQHCAKKKKKKKEMWHFHVSKCQSHGRCDPFDTGLAGDGRDTKGYTIYTSFMDTFYCPIIICHLYLLQHVGHRSALCLHTLFLCKCFLILINRLSCQCMAMWNHTRLILYAVI